MRSQEFVSEIERLSRSGFEGGKEHLRGEYAASKTIRKLPGSSGLLYSIQNSSGEVKIRLWDPNKGEFQPTPRPVALSYYSDRENNQRIKSWQEINAKLRAEFERAPGKLIGELVLDKPYRFPLPNALQVNVITVDEDYRGAGLAKALYGIVLTIMKRPLLAGSSQTPGGRRNWVSLSQIPGVQMKGYFSIPDSDLTSIDLNKVSSWEKSNVKYQNKQAEKTIDTIMGQLGGQSIGRSGSREFFAFDVKPTTSGQELESYVKTNLTRVYSDNYDSTSGLYAVWTGQ